MSTMTPASRVKAPEGYRCLVIGPIGNSLAPIGSLEQDTYVRALQVLGTLIDPACFPFGFTPVRADGIRRRGDIPTQIYEAIRDWDLVIADLTDANPNVMYELALRHYTGKCVIAIAEYERLPFDVSHIRTEQFVRTEAGLLAGRARLEAAIEEMLLTGGCDELPVTAIFQQIGTHAVAPYGEAPDLDQTDTVVEPALAPTEDMGFLDLLVETETALPELATHINAMAEAVEAIGNVFEHGTAEVTAADARGGSSRDRLLAAVRVARSLDTPTDLLEAAVANFGADLVRSGPGMEYVLDQVELDPTNPAAVEFLPTIVTLQQASRRNRQVARDLRHSVAPLASITKSLRPPVTRITFAIDQMIAASETIEGWGVRATAIQDQLAHSQLGSKPAGRTSRSRKTKLSGN